MKNIKFYEAPKYNTAEYEKIEDMIYRTVEEKKENTGCYSLRQCSDNELAEQLKKADGWVQGTGEFYEEYMIITHEGKKYYREIECIDTDEDIIFENNNDDSGEPNMIYVTSIVFEPEPELEENEPSAPYVSQYPLEDILDEFLIYCYDDYKKENEEDKEHSYVEFAADDIEDIRKVLTIIGKHVYNKQEGKYVMLKIE